jgi:hypothetical protein
MLISPCDSVQRNSEIRFPDSGKQTSDVEAAAYASDFGKKLWISVSE